MRRTPAAVTLALALAAAPVLPAASPAAAAAPTATVVVASTGLKVGDTSVVTFRFSEPVLGFSLSDVTVPSGTLSGLATSDSQVYTAVYTPAPGVTTSGVRLVLDNTGVTDTGGVPGTGITQSNAFAIDTQRPTAAVTVSQTALRAGSTATVTLAFSEAVTGLTTADLTVGAGTVSWLSTSDGGLTWTATLIPAADTEARGATVTLDLSGVSDLAGNAGSGTAGSAPYAVDTLRPTATVGLSTTALGIGGSATLTTVFSEPVLGFDLGDLTVRSGTVSGLSSIDGGITWTATFVPSAGTNATGQVLTVDLAGVMDLAGNVGAGTVDSPAYAVDTVRPTATLALAAARVTGPTTLTVTFSEPVVTLALTDLVADAGTLSGLATADGGLTWTATYTPDAGARVGAATIRLDLAGVVDLAGNAGVAAALSAPFAVEAPAAPGTPTVPGAPTVPVPAAPVEVPQVVAPVAAATAAPAAPGTRAAATLPRTGAETGSALVLALGLVLAGAAAVGVRARRARG